ncbi:cell adhesion molecule Dscam1-like [Brevipalpus obovatus]|uniref:cell adhesion molecule Dscam1-like n=1 Tax=Brevipalpus obovatus TaxID=246614 RepID=UPI003D9E84D3
MICYLLLILFAIKIVNSNESPKISLKPPKSMQKAEQQTDFSCVLQKGSLPVQFEWLKDGKIIQTSSKIEVDTSKKSSDLLLQSLAMSDAGNYTCRASNSFGSDQSTSQLIVEGSPQWLLKPVDILVGPIENFKIQCSGIGYPLPSVSWKKQIDSEWQDLFESSNIFTRITSTEITGHKLVKEKDEGRYGCEVSNGINPSLWTEFMIKVSGKIDDCFPVRSTLSSLSTFLKKENCIDI